MPKCCACPNESGTSRKIDARILRFTANKSRREQWTKLVQEGRREPNWVPSKNSFICTNHFDAMFFVFGEGKSVLSVDAAPTIFAPRNAITRKLQRVREIAKDEKVPVPQVGENNVLGVLNVPGKESEESVQLQPKFLVKTTASTQDAPSHSQEVIPDKHPEMPVNSSHHIVPVPPPMLWRKFIPPPLNIKQITCVTEAIVSPMQCNSIPASPMDLSLPCSPMDCSSNPVTPLCKNFPFAESLWSATPTTGCSDQQSVLKKRTTIASLVATPEHEESPRRRKIRQTLRDQVEKNRRKSNALRVALQGLKRMREKVLSLQTTMEELRKRSDVTPESADLLECLLPEEGQELIKRLRMKSEGSAGKKKFLPKLRSFVMTLYFYSKPAYKFVNKKLGNALPHPTTVERWYNTVNAQPGFTQESLDTLAKFSAKQQEKGGVVRACVMIDEMHIRKHVDGGHGVVDGFVDVGDGVADAERSDSLPLATKACCLLAIGLDGKWKLPIGYFMVHSFNGKERTNVMKMAITKLFEAGVIVEAITFDGASENLTMVTELGCIVREDPRNRLIVSFQHPSDTSEQVNIIQDPVHVIKLIRNALGDLWELVDKDGGRIWWGYIQKLGELQSKEGLHYANKLGMAHLQYSKRKQSVPLAVQTLSSSVADALEYLEANGHEEFIGAGPLVKFIRIFDRLFDIFNSKSMNMLGFKAAMSSKNVNEWLPFFHEAREYIFNLKHKDGNSVFKGTRRVAFTGFLIVMKSAEEMYNRLVVPEKIKCLAFYPLSQDHLEIFFGWVRQHGGYNPNPTSRQFKSAYKKLLLNLQVTSSERANIVPLADITMLTVGSAVRKIQLTDGPEITQDMRRKDFPDFYETSISPVEDDYYFQTLDNEILSRHADAIVPYMAGFVVKIIKDRHLLACETCLCALESVDIFPFVEQKNKGRILKKMTNPSQDVVKVARFSEICLREEMNSGRDLKSVAARKPHMIARVLTEACVNNVFNSLDEHVRSQEPFDNHVVTVVKLIADRIFKLRISHAARLLTEDIRLRTAYLRNRISRVEGQ